MAILPIADGAGRLNALAAIQTFAVMLHPKDEAARHQYLTAHYTVVGAAALDEGIPPSELSSFVTLLPALVSATQPPQRILEDGMGRSRRASLAGVELLFRLRCARHHPRHVAAYRARAIISETFSGFPTYGGEPAAASESTLAHAWAEFHSVAHLLAMHWWLIRTCEAQESPFLSSEVLLDDGGFLWALSVAECIRQLGEEEGFLDPDKMWRSPENLRLPDEEFDPEPLPAGIVRLLDRTFPT